MHRVFYVPELVELIVQNVLSDDPTSPRNVRLEFGASSSNLLFLGVDGYRDARSLSLTARVFVEPSLNAMWSIQYSLRPLLRSVDAVRPLLPARYRGALNATDHYTPMTCPYFSNMPQGSKYFISTAVI